MLQRTCEECGAPIHGEPEACPNCGGALPEPEHWAFTYLRRYGVLCATVTGAGTVPFALYQGHWLVAAIMVALVAAEVGLHAPYLK